MSLKGAMGVIMGANIGTTITTQIISFNLSEFAPVILVIGILMYIFSKNEKFKTIAKIFIGLGLLFIGMEVMKDSVSPLKGYEGFIEMIKTFGHNPILGVLLGVGITAVIQSSSATTGIVLALAAEGIMPLSSALPILYGGNIGTCVTSMVSSIGSNKNAKRAAVMHLIFNVVGTLIFMVCLTYITIEIVEYLNPADVARQVANAHTLFNIVTTLILLPFNSLIIKLALVVIPEEGYSLSKSKALKKG